MADHVEDEAYNSASDDDFTPDKIPVDDDAASSSSDEEDQVSNLAATKPKKPKISKKVTDGELDFDNSGDEATIQKGRRKKRKAEDDLEDGGDGGLVKTRAQRRAETNAKKPLQGTTASSLDVDALFAQMVSQKPIPAAEPSITTNSAPTIESSAEASPTTFTPFTDAIATAQVTTDVPDIAPPIPAQPLALSTIIIRRTYVFAGETQTEERTVAADSEEARLYLAQQAQSIDRPSTTASMASNTTGKPPLRRPTKRKSMFAAGGPDVSTAAAASKGPKLNTLEKSKLDWAAQVDREGISEELSEARKAKGTYLGRMDFLGRMDMKREEELKAAKGK